MFTLKFNQATHDYWEVYSASYYQVQENCAGERNVTFRDVDGDDVNLVISNNPKDWDVCYAVNEAGNTVDRIMPPKTTQGDDDEKANQEA